MGEDSERFSSQLEDMQQSLKETRQDLREVDHRISELQTGVGRTFEDILKFFKRREVLQFLGPPPAQGIDAQQLNQSIRNLCLGQTQEEILDRFLKQSAPYIDRALLFLEKDGCYIPWKSMGFETKQVEGVVASEPDDPIVRSAQEQRILYYADGSEDVFGWVTEVGERPATCVCVPMVFADGRVPLVLYADSDQPISVNSLELLSHLTVLVLKNHYLQCLIETGFQAGQTPAEALPVGPSDLPDHAASSQEKQPLEDESTSQLGQEAASPKRRGLRAADGSDAESEGTNLGETAAPSPDSVKEGEAEEQPATDESTKHRVDAQQLARLLVTEIRLHNREKLAQGRRFSDIYRRLRTDIDRGRDLYSKTVPPSSEPARDYFHEEVVKALALGNESILGKDYPGLERDPQPVETSS